MHASERALRREHDVRKDSDNSTQTSTRIALVTADGARAERHRVEHTPFTIGRGADRDLVLPHEFISREHARIVEANERLWIEDTHSRHGTMLNGKAVTRAAITPGDRIQLGGSHGLTLTVQTAAAAEDSIRGLLDEVVHSSDSELSKLNWLFEAARRLNATGGIEEILSSLLETTLALTHWERGYVYLCDGGELRLASARNNRGEALLNDTDLSHTAIQRALKTFEPYILTDSLAMETGSQAQSVVVNSIRAVISMPLRRRREAHSTEALGVLYLDTRLTPGVLSEADHGLLRTVAAEAATLVENAQLARFEADARRDREELAFAAGIQQRLMRVRLPELDYARVDARNLPCREVGGDFFDVLHDETGLALVVADVSGKGASAAILASTLQGMLYSQLAAGLPLATIARGVNTYLCIKDTGKYATMVLVRTTIGGHVEYINCGHVKPILLRAKASSGVHLEELGETNVPVGLLENAPFQSGVLTLSAGDTLILASDGITEAEDAEGQFFGPERLHEISRTSGGDLNRILAELEGFCGSTPATDDRTLLCLRYRADPF